jgi:hypothetical protein
MNRAENTTSNGVLTEQASAILGQTAACLELAQRIASSEIFARSEYLPKFLLYICDRYLSGKTHEITEQQIGERVFGRQRGYSPGEDSIVRNYAGQLRKRLELYYEREGKLDEVYITIPRGSYVPVFRPRSSPTAIQLSGGTADDRIDADITLVDLRAGEADSPALRVAPLISLLNQGWIPFLLGVGMSALVFAAVLLTGRIVRLPRSDSAAHLLWSALFSKNKDTFVVPADSGIGILQNLSQESVDLSDYASGKYLSNIKLRNIDAANLDDLRTQRYTSIVDLTIATRLARLPEVVPDRFAIRYARDLRMDDLRNENVVLIGAIHADPWVKLVQDRLNFQIVCGMRINDCRIVNLHPAPGEQSTYASPADNTSQKTFAVIAFRPNLSGTGHLLLIAGLNMAGTEAAGRMVLDSATIKPTLNRVALRDGSLRPFELLIETNSLGAEALPSRIIAARYGQ